MENAKERYSMWAMTNIRDPNSIRAAFDLIDCCLQLKEFFDAELVQPMKSSINEQIISSQLTILNGYLHVVPVTLL